MTARALQHYTDQAEPLRLQTENAKLRSAMESFFCEEVCSLVVNGHLMSDEDRAALTRDIMAKLGDIYETMRIALDGPDK